MTFEEVIDNVGRGVDAIGVAIVVLGSLAALVPYAVARVTRSATLDSYRSVRRSLGRSILLGLEFLVAADIIRTVAVSPTLGSVAALGLIVLIRTFLSFALEVEIEGGLPWRRAQAHAEGVTPPAAG